MQREGKSVSFGVWLYCVIHWYVSAPLGCYHTAWFSDMSLQFWVVIKLLDELINWYTFGMWLYYDSFICQNTSGMLSHNWHSGILLGCGPAAGFTIMSVQMWDVILLYVSLICQYTFVMWFYCMFHWSVDTLVGVIPLWDSLICKYTRGMWSYCRIHWYITTFLGCDPTMWFTGTLLQYYTALNLRRQQSP